MCANPGVWYQLKRNAQTWDKVEWRDERPNIHYTYLHARTKHSQKRRSIKNIALRNLFLFFFLFSSDRRPFLVPLFMNHQIPPPAGKRLNPPFPSAKASIRHTHTQETNGRWGQRIPRINKQIDIWIQFQTRAARQLDILFWRHSVRIFFC